MDEINGWWSVTIILGPIFLGMVIAYALLSRRRLSHAEKVRQARATHELYSDPDGTRSAAVEVHPAEGVAPIPPVKSSGR
jgi:hypothetical protein